MTGQYVVDVEHGQAMGMNDLKIRPTICAVVKFDGDGAVAWRGNRYWAGQEPRNMKAAAGKMRKRWQSYYERTGKRFEVEEREKREAKRAEEKARKEAARRVRDAAPELLEALKRLIDDPRTAEEAMAVIAKAEGR